jgi:hypothetical protein
MDKDKFGDHGILGIKQASQEMILTIFPWFCCSDVRHRGLTWHGAGIRSGSASRTYLGWELYVCVDG